jgi:hypothetical protein
LLGRLKSTIPDLQISLPKTANSEKLGLGLDNPCRIDFFFSISGCYSAWRGLMTGIFGILGSSATQRYQDVTSTQEFFLFCFFFFVVTSIVFGFHCWKDEFERKLRRRVATILIDRLHIYAGDWLAATPMVESASL